MNRRKFLSLLGIGTAVVAVAPSAVAPSAVAECSDPWCGSIAGEGIIPHDELHVMWPNNTHYNRMGLEQYIDYSNFSDLALSASVDETVSKSAEELAHNFGLRVDELVRS